MGPAVFALVTSFVLVVGSTQISEPVLAISQLILGIWFAVAGAIQGYQSTRD
jgi:hypothetical protein